MAAMLALGAFGSGIAYVWNYAVITHAGAAVVSTVTYWTPLLGVAVSQGRLRRKTA